MKRSAVRAFSLVHLGQATTQYKPGHRVRAASIARQRTALRPSSAGPCPGCGCRKNTLREVTEGKGLFGHCLLWLLINDVPVKAGICTCWLHTKLLFYKVNCLATCVVKLL
jgi:hypothetical protein